MGRTLYLIGVVLKAKGDLKHAEGVLKTSIDMLKGVRFI
jgi:hypothetical protein